MYLNLGRTTCARWACLGEKVGFLVPDPTGRHAEGSASTSPSRTIQEPRVRAAYFSKFMLSPSKILPSEIACLPVSSNGSTCEWPDSILQAAQMIPAIAGSNSCCPREKKTLAGNSEDSQPTTFLPSSVLAAMPIGTYRTSHDGPCRLTEWLRSSASPSTQTLQTTYEEVYFQEFKRLGYAPPRRWGT